MAGVDTGGGAHARRAPNVDLNMIPFVDLLFMLTAFLLITAVWSSSAQLPANAHVGGPNDGAITDAPAKMLHVYAGEKAFRLAWKRGDVVLSETEVPKQRVDGAFPELASAVGDAWRNGGEHRAADDLALDVAVLHTDDRMAFDEVAATMDAIYSTHREAAPGSATAPPAFSVTFSVK